MKLCNDCQHIKAPLFPTQTPFCGHPKAPINPVHGGLDGTCYLMRSSNCLIEHCGPEADWFEARVFSLAPIKQEGAAIPFDENALPPLKKSFWKRLFSF